MKLLMPYISSVAGDSSNNSCGSIRDGVFLRCQVSVGLAREFLEETFGLVKRSARVVRKLSRLVLRRAKCFLEFLIQPVVVIFYADFQLLGTRENSYLVSSLKLITMVSIVC